MKTPSLVAGAFSLAVLFSHQPIASAQSTDSACAFVSVGIVTASATVFPGAELVIGGSLRNCSNQKARYRLVVTGASSCGQRAEISSSKLALGPGENRTWSLAYTMPTNTCSGIWEASVRAYEGREDNPASSSSGRALVSSSATVIVD